MVETTTGPLRRIPAASIPDTLAVFGRVLVPIIARGVIIRRPVMVAMAERFDLDRRAVQTVQRLRGKYGTGPLLLRVPFRQQALILDPQHVHRVLDQSPEPFATATFEKRAALSHFQPHGSLISHGVERADRRRFNEQVLDFGNPLHQFAERQARVVAEEVDYLLATIGPAGLLDWETFIAAWFRIVRRVVFGDHARDDTELREVINALRGDANWAFAKPKRETLRRDLFDRLDAHLARAEPGSLAAMMATTPSTAMTEPTQQVPQWLFAFDPAGMAAFRTLALLATHPNQATRAREEIRSTPNGAVAEFPFLRACVLDALRLWPTTPMVLRENTRATRWETGVLPAHTHIIIFANFFHRDDETLPDANRFNPDLWLQPRGSNDWPLIPFSGGPAICPGRDLVLQLTSMFLARLLDDREVSLKPPIRLSPQFPLPGTLNNYGLAFRVEA